MILGMMELPGGLYEAMAIVLASRRDSESMEAVIAVSRGLRFRA